MNESTINSDRLLDLIEMVCEEAASENERVELDRMLLVNEASRCHYLNYCWMHVALEMELQANKALEVCRRSYNDSVVLTPWESDVLMATGVPAIPAYSPTPVFSNALSNAIGYLSSDWLVAYSIATVIFGIGALIGAFTYVSQPVYVADRLPMVAENFGSPTPSMESVGGITGMVDCVWADLSKTPVSGHVAVGHTFALTSGLMEITYNTGAKVILQGPVTYEVESNGGGYLSLGKLTARVDGAKPQAANPPSALRLPPSALFSVRTPTATVTDLGTEFGVEVSKEGITETHVFVGKVRVEGRAEANNASGRIISAGQGVRLDAHAVMVDVSKSNENRFLRKMPALVATSSRELIGQIDYSDTWTANTMTRPGTYLLLKDRTLRVEQCPGNPMYHWVFSVESAITTRPSAGSLASWPGHNVRGSLSGFTESNDRFCYLGLEYGLRDDFVVEFDAVQTDDRINITIGDKPVPHGSQSLSVFFRASGTPYPEIGVFSFSAGDEADTRLRSGIAAPYQWHNYAVRFNCREKQLTIWVDRQERGIIDLTHVTKGMKSGHTWADLPWTNQYVTVGGACPSASGWVWTDNFRVGSPRETADPVSTRHEATAPPRQEKR